MQQYVPVVVYSNFHIRKVQRQHSLITVLTIQPVECFILLFSRMKTVNFKYHDFFYVHVVNMFC